MRSKKKSRRRSRSQSKKRTIRSRSQSRKRSRRRSKKRSRRRSRSRSRKMSRRRSRSQSKKISRRRSSRRRSKSQSRKRSRRRSRSQSKKRSRRSKIDGTVDKSILIGISHQIAQKMRHDNKIVEIINSEGYVDIDDFKKLISGGLKEYFTPENIIYSYLIQTVYPDKIDKIDIYKLYPAEIDSDEIDIKNIEDPDKKRRWKFIRKKEKGEDGKEVEKMYVTVYQGHDKKIADKIENPNIKLIEESFPVYHGTTLESSEIILKEGLKPMTRSHIHMAQKLSGIRRNSEVILVIDLKKAMENGIKFFKAPNNVILCDQIIPSEYIKKLDKFQEFEKIENISESSEVLKYFKVDLQTTGNILYNILESNTKKLKIVCYKNPNLLCYLIFVVGKNDDILMNLGKAYNFPRGMPIFYIPNKQINIYGFYPKFDNDARNQVRLDNSEFEGEELNFNYKYSGFLGQIIPFSIDGIIFWTTCSKNATDTKFSKDLYRIINTKMTSDLVQKLCDKKIHFCGETMSKKDQMHGSKIEKEEFIVTSVGNGKWYELNKKGDEEKYHFVKFYSNEDMQKFAKENNLAVDNTYKIRGSSNIISFMKFVENERNFIDIKKMEEIIGLQRSNIIIEYGNVTHKDICGDILEGLIIKINDKGKIKTIKYKFPFYTARTMLLRNYINVKIHTDEYKFDVKGIPICLNLFDDFLNDSKKYISHWVVNIKDDQEKWGYILLYLYNNFKIYTEEYIKYVEENNDIESQHIYVMDKLMLDYNENKIKYEGYNPINEKNTKMIIPIVLCLGPIGVGKSTTSEAIVARMNMVIKYDKFVHIDGDVLDLDMSKVLNLGEERNPYTLWQIYKTLLDGKVPVVSLGGGLLIDFGKEKTFNLFRNIENVFKPKGAIDYNLTILLPDNKTGIITNIEEYLKDNILDDIFEEYQNKLKDIVDERNKRLIENLYDIGSMSRINATNLEFSKTIIKDSKQKSIDEHIKVTFLSFDKSICLSIILSTVIPPIMILRISGE